MHLLISGIPASGESTFCRWLEEEKGFLHLDVEKPGVLDRYGLATAWDALFAVDAMAAPFVEALERFKRPVAIDWGFPPECLETVRKLFDGGVMLWWFAADWAVARRKFAERGSDKSPIEAFDIQIRKIKAANPEINALFGSHVVYALPTTGIYTPLTKSGRACSTPSPPPPEDTRAFPDPRPPINNRAPTPHFARTTTQNSRPGSQEESESQPRRIRDPITPAIPPELLVPNSEQPVPFSEQRVPNPTKPANSATINQFCGIRKSPPSAASPTESAPLTEAM